MGCGTELMAAPAALAEGVEKGSVKNVVGSAMSAAVMRGAGRVPLALLAFALLMTLL